MLSKIYVGNLPPETSEGSVRTLFTENGVNATHIQVKRGGYAFVDCADQTELDKAIEQLNGCQYQGHSIIVEPSVAGGGPKSKMLETRVRVSGVPVQSLDEDLENLLNSVGEVQKCEKYVSRDGQTQVVQVSYVSADSAKEAATTLNGAAFEGGSLRVERIMDRRPRNTRQTGNNMDRRMGGSPLPQRHAEFPLRVLVLSEMVGAIIGRQGATIRTITQQSRARVDVHRKDNAGSLEKAITIYGNPENCTSACKRILEVMQEEANTINKGEVPLKILAHNNLIGRIIGKGGATIKKIMEDTNTRITVSSINDISNFNLERIITIKAAKYARILAKY